MAKDTFWFSHDFNARNDERMLSLRDKYEMTGVGLYWSLIEIMAESSDRQISFVKLPVIARELWFDLEKLQEIIKFCCAKDSLLFRSNKNFFWSESLRKRLKIKDLKSEQARKAAYARHDADAVRTHNGRIATEREKEVSNKEGERENPAPITFEFLLGEVTKNCESGKFSKFIPYDLAVKLSHVIKSNGFKKANGKDVEFWESQIFLLMEKELEFSK